MARTKLIITSFNTDKYHDIIALFPPSPRSLEVNMSESREEGKHSSLQSSSNESFTKRSFPLKPEHLATHLSDSNTCNKQSAIPSDQQQGFASVEFVQKAIDNQNDRFSQLEHTIKNLISGLHQARPSSGRKHTRGSTEIQDGDTSLMPAVSTRPEDTGSSFPDGSLGTLPKKRNSLTNWRKKFLARLICLLHRLMTQCLTTSHQRMFLKTIWIPVILTKAMIENFLHPPRNLMLQREILLT